MQRYKLTLEYNGSGFVGWQRQKNGLGIQEAMERSIERFCGESVTVFGSGRTDAGVHAMAQVAHFDIKKVTNNNTVRDALNHYLKKRYYFSISCRSCGSRFSFKVFGKKNGFIYIVLLADVHQLHSIVGVSGGYL